VPPERPEESFFGAVAEAQVRGRRAAVATVVRVAGSAPRSLGAKMLVGPTGRIAGTVGGGALEATVIRAARASIRSGEPQLIELSLWARDPANVGVCGGDVAVFIDPVLPPPRLHIVGAGHVGYHLARLAARMDFRIQIVDERAEFATRERFPEAESLLSGPARRVVSRMEVGEDSYVALMTVGYKTDTVWLRHLLPKPWAYLGMIGSRAKVKRVLETLREEGAPAARLKRVHAPIGLEIGAETPAEIAVSVLAEITSVRRSGRMPSPKGRRA
jgi:xanthine dehydrogenase accessory factor